MNRYTTTGGQMILNVEPPARATENSVRNVSSPPVSLNINDLPMHETKYMRYQSPYLNNRVQPHYDNRVQPHYDNGVQPPQYSNRVVTPQFENRVQPHYDNRVGTPHSNRVGTPHSNRVGTPHSNRVGIPHSSQNNNVGHHIVSNNVLYGNARQPSPQPAQIQHYQPQFQHGQNMLPLQPNNEGNRQWMH